MKRREGGQPPAGLDFFSVLCLLLAEKWQLWASIS